MTPKRRVFLLASLAVAAIGLGVIIVGDAKYLFVSTYRVNNEIGPTVARVRLTLERTSGPRPVGVFEVARGSSRTGWLRFSGEASLKAEAEGNRGNGQSCSTYVGGSLYHVDVNVSAKGQVECRVRMVNPLEINILTISP